ncbi:hypothetical protein CLU89_3879 [Acidovorax sp. 30]|nr:hypothetical protein CLU87_0682 [Acidovorax sp. 59]PKW04198.1 hypothetical protein CLU89_3879 [Acidovorax sp. 30]
MAAVTVEQAASFLDIDPSKFIDEAIRFDIWIYIEVPIGAPLAATYLNSSRRALDAFKHDDFGALATEDGNFSGYIFNYYGAAFQFRVGSEVLRAIKRSGVSWQQRFWDFRRSASAPEFHSAFTGVEDEARWRDPTHEATACFISPIIRLREKYSLDFYVIKKSHLLVSGPDLARWMGYAGYDSTGRYPRFPRDRHNFWTKTSLQQEEANQPVSFDEPWAQQVIQLVDELLNLLYQKKTASISHFTVDRGAGLRELVKVYCGFMVRYPKGPRTFERFDEYLFKERCFSAMEFSANYKHKLFHVLIAKSVFAEGNTKRLGTHLARTKILKELEGLQVSKGLLIIISVAAEYIGQDAPVSASVLDKSFIDLGISANNMPVIKKILALHDTKTGPKPAKAGKQFFTP